MSNILDSELIGRKPVERSHGKVVGESVVNDELLSEVVQGKERVGVIETLLIFSMAALHLLVVSGGVGTDELVPDTQFSSSGFKESRQISFTVGKTIGEFKTVVSLNVKSVK